MVSQHNGYEKKIRNNFGRVFTPLEAIEFEREMLNSPTGTTNLYQWVDSKTKCVVNFSY